MDKRKPLFSMIVIMYNSFKTIVETLNSIKSRDYFNIELIISDDCSSDEKLNICKLWLREKTNIFKRVDIITFINTITSTNCNQRLSINYRKHPKSIVLNLDFVHGVYQSFLICRKSNLQSDIIDRIITYLEEGRFKYIFDDKSNSFGNKVVSFLIYKIAKLIR